MRFKRQWIGRKDTRGRKAVRILAANAYHLLILCTLGLMQNTYPVVKIPGTERIISDNSQASIYYH